MFFDTYHDRRNGIGFVVNPLGGFTDLQITNEEDANTDWNPITEIRTGRFDSGWTVEMAIPFRSLRYRAGANQVWGSQMRRSVIRKNEWNHLAPVPFAVAGNGTRGPMRVSMYGSLVGIEAPPQSVRLELKPYGITGLETDRTVTPGISNDGTPMSAWMPSTGSRRTSPPTSHKTPTSLRWRSMSSRPTSRASGSSFPRSASSSSRPGHLRVRNGGRGPTSAGEGGPPGAAAISSSGRSRGGRFWARSRTDGISERDQSYRIRAGYRGDTWSGSIDHVPVGEGFNPEIGFVRRSDPRETNVFGRFSPLVPSVDAIRRVTFAGLVGYFENERLGFVESRSRGGRLELEFENGDWLTINATDSYERLSEDTSISGATMPAGAYSFRDTDATYYFGPHRRLSGSVSVTRGSFYSGSVTSFGVSQGKFEVLPQLSVEPSFELNWIDLPDLQQRDGEFDQHVARTRVTYSLSPRTYLSGLVQYNTRSEAVGANVRVRWEWAPGSEVFVVYSENRDTSVLDRWSELTGRTLVVKATLVRF